MGSFLLRNREVEAARKSLKLRLFAIVKGMTESIIFVDENDNPIGTGTREEAWAKGIYVRIVRAILKD